MRALAALLVALLAAGAAAQDAAETLPKADLQLLSEVVRLIKRDFARLTDDAVLASGCAEELSSASGSGERAARTLDALPGLLLRAHAAAAGRIGYRKLAEFCIAGMVTMLDKHSQYLDQDEARELYRGAGGVAAIGLDLRRDGNDLTVVDVFDNSPAARAGLRAGDVLERIDGVPLEPLSLREAVRKLRGAVGSTVALQVRRPGTATPLDLVAKREIIREQTVRAAWVEGDVLEVRISRLAEGTRGELHREVARLAANPVREPRGIILDLRGNSGGLLTAAVDLSGVFLADGVTVGSMRGRAGRLISAYRANDPAGSSRYSLARPEPLPPQVAQALKNSAMVVLVAKRTASGAEILAAALQANGRAVLAGEPTFGMGSIQTLFPLGPAGRGAMLKLTTSYWFGAKDGELDGKPLEPDLPASGENAMRAALRWFEQARAAK